MKIVGLFDADKASEAGAPPTKELLENMGRFIEEVTNAGVLLATDGLQPSSKGARVELSEGKGSKPVVAGALRLALAS